MNIFWLTFFFREHRILSNLPRSHVSTSLTCFTCENQNICSKIHLLASEYCHLCIDDGRLCAAHTESVRRRVPPATTRVERESTMHSERVYDIGPLHHSGSATPTELKQTLLPHTFREPSPHLPAPSGIAAGYISPATSRPLEAKHTHTSTPSPSPSSTSRK